MEKIDKAINFEFTEYKFEPEEKRASFYYKTEFEGREAIVWKEEIILPEISQDILNELQDKPSTNNLVWGESNATSLTIEKILQSLHIILGISYWKFYCPPAVTFAKVKEGATGKSYCATQLTKNQAEFWNTIYKKGLGEFFYRNNLNPNKSPKFPYDNEKKIIRHCEKVATDEAIFTTRLPRRPLAPRNNDTRYLVGVSGGKDSIVGVELLKEAGENLTAFYIETLNSRFLGNDNENNKENIESNLVDKVTKLTGLAQLKIQRILDPKVFEKHQYNGHIPISAIYAFLGIFASVLYKYNGFVVSNEYSSNFGNAKYKGLEINHQWSKTFEFEKIFSDYVKEFIEPNLEYFSLLRPFYEIRIAEMFARFEARHGQYPKYFSSFSSCNANFKIKNETGPVLRSSDRSEAGWCGKCAKCVFVFTLLSAFLNKKELLNIFKKNLFQNQTLMPLFKDVLGLGNLKPFDCVGTFEEAQTAFKMASKNYNNDFIVIQLVKKTKIYSEVFKTQAESNIPEKFKFLGMKNALILGYGKEGIITKKYLQNFYPKLKIGIADKKLDGKSYLEKQNNYDIAIKTPGINKRLVTIPYTTATNIFLSKVLGKNLIIGVTGSKGKSTTTSLIYEIVKASGKDVRILGNIGLPMLGALLEPINPETIFVLELSSYQLDDIRFSPDISVVTNLFPEHMDFHGNLKNYFEAKKNIINFQTLPLDGQAKKYFIYNPKNKIMTSWLKDYKGKSVAFLENNLKSNLLGQHNKSNIGAAVEVAKILNISEEIISKTVENFKGLPHRLEFVGEFKQIKFYNDAISTTPESTIMAIESLSLISKIGTIFLGGQDRGFNFIKLEKLIKKEKIKNIVLFPDSGKKIIKSAVGLNILHTKDMKQAIKFAYKYTEKGSICLLSCASPSYSIWENFEEKGNLFKKFVKQLS